MNNRIYDLLKHTYKTVPYYRDLFDDKGIDINLVKNNDNFEIIPILNKSDIIKLPGIFVSSDCLIYPKSENLIVRKTSGSTGIILKIYWTKQDYIRSLLPLWLIRKKYYGIEPYMKFCSFHSTVYVDDKVEAPEICLFDSGRNLSFCKHKLNKDQMGKYYAEIVKFQPVWLMLQPSIAYILSEFISCNNMEVPQSIKYIELTGEYLTEGCRKMVHETFKTPVANLYGCEEINGIAMECPNGNMHCIGSNVVVEIMDGGRTVGYGREGEIYITGLNNTTMPFIRYSLGDRGILFPPGTCACENCNPVLKILAGRLSESFIVKEGRLVNSFIFYHAVEDINAKYDNIIIQFQVVQESSSKLLAKLVLKQQQRIDINIIHLSIGTTKIRYWIPFKKAVKSALKNNIIVVSAADNNDRRSYPAYLNDVVGVKRAQFNNVKHYSYKYDTHKVQRYINKNKGHISIGLSIDGNKIKHDTQRVKLDGTGSYDDVARNVPLWLKQFPDQGTKATFSHDDLSYLKDSVISLWNDLGIKMVMANIVFEDVWKEGDDVIYENQLRKLADFILENEMWRDYSV